MLNPNKPTKGYVTCVLITCFLDITYKIITIAFNIHPLAKTLVRFKSPNCKALYSVDLYLFTSMKLFSICVMLWGIKACITKNLYSFNTFRCLFYAYLFTQVVFLFFISTETIMSNCSKLKLKAKITIGLLMLLVGFVVLTIYAGIWLYYIDRANDFLQRDGNKEYNEEIDSSGNSGIEFRASHPQDDDERQSLKPRNGTGEYPNYGTTKDDLNPKDSDGKHVLTNIGNSGTLQNSSDMLL